MWSRDLGATEKVVARFEAGGFWGPALQVDRLAARAGLAALRGNGPEALAGFREAVRAYRGLGLAFDEAAAAVDMATLLGAPERDAPDVVAAINAARETLTRLGARPFLVQLDKVLAATGSPAAPAAGRATTVRESVSPGTRPE